MRGYFRIVGATACVLSLFAFSATASLISITVSGSTHGVAEATSGPFVGVPGGTPWSASFVLDPANIDVGLSNADFTFYQFDNSNSVFELDGFAPITGVPIFGQPSVLGFGTNSLANEYFLIIDLAPFSYDGGTPIFINQTVGPISQNPFDGTGDITTNIGVFDVTGLSTSGTFLNSVLNLSADTISVVVVPEPASMALLGLAGLTILRRRTA